MPSGNGARVHLSLLLTALMLFPILLSVAVLSLEPRTVALDSRSSGVSENGPRAYIGELGIPQINDPSHGWWNSNGVGEALLYHRKATYVPLGDWQTTTGERVISGWHILGHEYPLPSNWKDDLGELGIECRTFYSPQGFHCDVPDLSLGTLMEAGVMGAFRLDPTDKLAPDMLPLVWGMEESNAIMEGDMFVINVLLSGNYNQADILSSPVDLREIYASRLAKVVADEKGIEWLVGQEFVEWVEPDYPVQLTNDEAAGILNVDWVGDPSNMGGPLNTLSGSGVIVAVADSGLDTTVACGSTGSYAASLLDCDSKNGVTSGVLADFVGRIASVQSFHGSCNDDGPSDDHGHGTHVTGSVLGDGSSSLPDGENFAGMAPEANLYMQAIKCGSSLYPPSDYENELFLPAYDFGARVHTNSWGTGPSGSTPNYYSSSTLMVDEAAYEMDDMVILYAMGNDGSDDNSNGEIDLAFMNRQATAKNILSIGASENFRPTLTGSTWGTANSDKWGASPISSDYLANDIEGLAAFSNRGPTDDGRIKPDLVAPGTYIISTRSAEAGASCIGTGFENYCYNQGTSMATPITAGSTALILEHLNNQGYTDQFTKSNDPASAMVKAMLASGAHDMEGQYSTGGDGKNGATAVAPNPHEGWGLVDLQGTVESSFMDGISITTQESHSMRLTVPVGLSEFRVVLSWNDPPNSPSAGKQLINDLDIFLKNPSGDTYNYVNDDVNNLVGVTVESPDAGDWEVIVSGANVADGPQTYYVAVSDGLAITDMRHPISDTLNSAGFQSGSIFTETTVSVGGNHICAIMDDSSLQCWGGNSFGQVGDGTTTDRLTMTTVALDTGRTAVSVSTGAYHTCATLDDSSLKCWGRNNKGQLGDGSTDGSPSPVPVGLGGFPVQVSSGLRHTCAVLVDASLECWGDNANGQLGIGSNSDSSNPVPVSFTDGKKVLAVSAGASHTCAVLDDRSLQCWGENGEGQLGIGSHIDSNSPSVVDAGGYVVAVSAGNSHTCALMVDQNLKCWGGNSQSQLGSGNQVSQDSPTSAVLADVISFDVGDEHSCAVNLAQVLHCWGANSDSQVGDGTTTTATSPATISLDSGLGTISVSAGGSFSCVTASNDLLRCWGGEDLDSITMGSSPREVELPRWTYINSAERDLDGDGMLNLFDTHEPQDGDGDGFSGVDDVDDDNPARAADCSAGSYGRYICRQATVGFFVSNQGSLVMTPATPGHYVDTDGATIDEECQVGTYQERTGQTSCDPSRAGYYVDTPGSAIDTPCPGGTFNPDTGAISVDVCDGSEPGYNVPILTQISSGSHHTCAILDDGSMKCWGENTNGQLGDGTRSGHATPGTVLLPLGKSAVSISAGSYHTCAILDDGSLRCWGSNEFGQLGDGTSIERTSPVSIDLGSGRTASSVSAGESHTCAVLDDSSVMCWGENSNGQIGDGTSTNSLSPVSVGLGDGNTAISMSSGSYHTCAITDDRTVKCWGNNWHGQLGDGSTGNRISPTEIDLPVNSSAVTLSSGSFHTCVGLNDGSMFCWGYNAYGQLGNGNNSNSLAPSTVGLIESESATQVSMGMFHSCALFDSGSVSCWGGNSEGQLGSGDLLDSLIPQSVALPAGMSALSISIGQRHSCAILDDATLYCWGYNANGQIGDGTTVDRLLPANIDLQHGSSAQIPCSPGTFQPSASQTSCILAGRGYNVPLQASLNQTGCIKGTYSSLRGQESCSIASIGYYVDEFLADSQTACPPFNSTVQRGSNNFDLCKPDFDGDMTPDVTDLDDDGDGVEDRYDFDPLDPEVSVDFDGDNIPDSLDSDDDNDGVNDTTDLFPYNQDEWGDEDGDGTGDNSDTDDDNDGREDSFDVFPNDPEEWSDFDGDGVGDNADEDDDNDGVNDVDNNPFVNLDDAFPLDSTEWIDTDGDSIGNNADTDDDGDGFDDAMDVFPLDPTEWLDNDGDTFGDNFDWDDNNPFEWMDSDGDQIGDNGDECPDEQGLNSSFENFAHKLALPGNRLGCPLFEGEIVVEEEEGGFSLLDVDVLDTDGDGQVDFFDPDDDNDGIPDEEDGKLDHRTGVGEFSKDPTRPFGERTWIVILLSSIFISLMGVRLVSWKRRKFAMLKSKRIRLG